MISVVIPVYNAEPYLNRCLDSVLGSTYSDFEVILIDDGSTDESLGLCRAYAQRDGRVRVLSQDNRGAAAARNRGLEVCTGEWTVFVDADDLISPRFLERIAREEARDLLLFDFAPGPDMLDLSPPGARTVYSGREGGPDLLQSTLLLRQLRPGGRIDFLSPCARAFRTSALRRWGLRFDRELYMGEDTLFNIEFLLRAESWAYIPQAVYFYNLHSDSSSRRFHPDLLDNYGRLLDKVRRALENRGAFARLEREYRSYTLDLLASGLFRGIFSPASPKTFGEKRAMAARLWEEGAYRQAMRYSGGSGSFQRRLFLLLFRLRQYWALDAVSRLFHRLWHRRGIC